MFKTIFLMILMNISFIFSCPDGFVENIQYTGAANQDECYPENFVYFSSIAQGFYLFLEVDRVPLVLVAGRL